MGVIKKLGTSGGTGYVLEYIGDVISNFSMEARMTLCNMSIEAGARAALVAPDEKTISYINGRPLAPKGEEFEEAKIYWKSLVSDSSANYDEEINIDANKIEPCVTW